MVASFVLRMVQRHCVSGDKDGPGGCWYGEECAASRPVYIGEGLWSTKGGREPEMGGAWCIEGTCCPCGLACKMGGVYSC